MLSEFLGGFTSQGPNLTGFGGAQREPVSLLRLKELRSPPAMNLRGIVQRLIGVAEPHVLPSFTKHHDPDLGDFTLDQVTASWFVHREVDAGRIMIRGRSLAPTPDQKLLIEKFSPLLPSLTEASAAMLLPPHESPTHDIPRQLVLRELRFESSGVAELFFDPEIDVDGYTLWPMATCSLEGELQSTDWTT